MYDIGNNFGCGARLSSLSMRQLSSENLVGEIIFWCIFLGFWSGIDMYVSRKVLNQPRSLLNNHIMCRVFT